MSIVITILNQDIDGTPLCAMTVDSCQTKIMDPRDPSKNQYYHDVNKIHVFGNFLIAECGNPHGFAQYWRIAEQSRIAGGGIEFFMDRSEQIMQQVGRDWLNEYARRWAFMTRDQLRTYSRTVAIIAGWSRRHQRILVREITDKPEMSRTLDHDGAVVSGGSGKTRRDTQEYLREMLVGRHETPSPGLLRNVQRFFTGGGDLFNTLGGIMRASRLAGQHAAQRERAHTGARTIGGQYFHMFLAGDQPPRVYPEPPPAP